MKQIHFINETLKCPFKNNKIEPHPITGTNSNKYNCKFKTHFQKDLEQHIYKIHDKLEFYKNNYKYNR
jgi:hypothetical protein